MGKDRKLHKVLVEKPEKDNSEDRCEDGLRMNLGETG
jgi:hypothetical protein